MINFEINGKEYTDFKLTYKGIKYLNKITGGAFETVAKAMQGDLDLFPHIIYACVISEDKKITLRQVEEAIEKALEDEKLDLLGILRISNEIVTDSFFYKATVTKMLSNQTEATKALRDLLS